MATQLKHSAVHAGSGTAGKEWSFVNPVRIVFGAGKLDELGKIAGIGRFLLVTTPGFTRRGITDRIRAAIGKERVVVFDGVQPNPDLAGLEQVSADLRDASVDGIIALGGGSAMDTAKALGVALAAAGTAFSLRAHLQAGGPLPDAHPLPVFAVPTTAGTGSEVTPFATIWDKESQKKYSLTSPLLFPHTAILDPLLTISLPEDETVSSGLDALSQGLESIWNRNANPITISLATRAVKIAFDALPRLVSEPRNVELRSQMMEASLLAGLAISSTRTSLAHSMSYPLTARYQVPHGLACSFTLAALCEYNSADDDGRLSALALSLELGSSQDLTEALRQLLREIRVGERVRRYISSLDDLLELAPHMFTPGRADNNMRSVGVEAVTGILTTAWRDVLP